MLKVTLNPNQYLYLSVVAVTNILSHESVVPVQVGAHRILLLFRWSAHAAGVLSILSHLAVTFAQFRYCITLLWQEW